mgnify:CR=1 FL=1
MSAELVQELQMKNERQKAEITKIVQQLEQVKKDLNQKTENIFHLNQEIEKLKSQSPRQVENESSNLIQELQRKIEKQKTEIQQLKQQSMGSVAESLQNQIKQLHQEIASKNLEILDLRNETSEKLVKITELSKELKELQTQFKEIQSLSQQNVEKITHDFQKTIDELQHNSGIKEELLQIKDQEIEKQRKELTEQREKLKLLTDQIKDMHVKFEQIQTETKAQDFQKIIKDAQEKIISLTEQVKELEKWECIDNVIKRFSTQLDQNRHRGFFSAANDIKSLEAKIEAIKFTRIQPTLEELKLSKA